MESSGGPPVNNQPGPAGGVLRRLAATLLDMVLFCSLCAAIALPVARTVDWGTLPSDVEHITSVLGDASWIGRVSGVAGMCIALWWCYFVVGWGLLGATPGKWLAGLRVVDHRGRSPIGISRAVMRLFAYAVSSLTFGIGHLMVLFRSDGCALHDLLAGTRVIRSPRWRSRRTDRAPMAAGDQEPDEPTAGSESRSVEVDESSVSGPAGMPRGPGAD
jgi:uncharacterized RDD family membrane protein YckC